MQSQIAGAAVASIDDAHAEVQRGGFARLFADLREIARDFWDHRDLLYQLTRRDIRIRYKQAVMGFGWALFMPAVIILAGMVVRVAMAHVAGGQVELAGIAGVAVKAVPWAFFVGAIGFATPALTANMNLVTKIYFPREVLPLSATLAQSFDTLIGLAVLLAVLPLLGVLPSATWVWVPVLALMLFLFTAAAALFLSCANLFFRDVKYLVQVMLMFGIFFTPVLFEPAMFGVLGSQILMLNPLSPMIEGLRLAVVEGHNLLQPLVHVNSTGVEILAWHPGHLIAGGVWGVAGLIGAGVLFHRSEFIFAEYV